MAVKKVNPNNMITEEVTFSYVHLFTPKADDKGILKYSACLLLDKTNKKEKARWEAGIEAAIEKGIEKGLFTANQRAILKLPIRDGDLELEQELKKGQEYKGRWFINCNSNAVKRDGSPNPAPEVTKPQGGIAVPITDQSEFYSGCKGRAIISFYPFGGKSAQGSRGIAVAINGAYKTGEGERLDGRVSATSAFAAFAEADSVDEESGSSEFE